MDNDILFLVDDLWLTNSFQYRGAIINFGNKALM